ncbi:phosphatidate cytidylyltransferase, partial [Rhizobium sp. KAs_5_22]
TIFFIISFVFIYNTGNKNEINDFVNLLKTTKRTGFSLFILMSVLFAAIGDLYFSLIKRQLGIKDYSKLLKEHGGLLD